MKVGMVIIAVVVALNLVSTAALWNSRSGAATELNNKIIEIQRAEEDFETKVVEAAERS